MSGVDSSGTGPVSTGICAFFGGVALEMARKEIFEANREVETLKNMIAKIEERLNKKLECGQTDQHLKNLLEKYKTQHRDALARQAEALSNMENIIGILSVCAALYPI